MCGCHIWYTERGPGSPPTHARLPCRPTIPRRRGHQTSCCYFAHGRYAKYCGQHVYVFVCCLLVCLSARISQKPLSKFHKISVHVTVAVAWCSSICRQYDTLCTSGFVDDVMFFIAMLCYCVLHSCEKIKYIIIYNRRYRPESKTRRKFRPVRQVAVPRAKYVVSDCISLKTAS